MTKCKDWQSFCLGAPAVQILTAHFNCCFQTFDQKPVHPLKSSKIISVNTAAAKRKWYMSKVDFSTGADFIGQGDMFEADCSRNNCVID